MNYKIPIDSREEEKAIGGVLTFKQFGWLAIGFLGFLAIFAVIYASIRSMFIGIFFGLIPVAITIPFAFLKIHDMTLMKYINTSLKFKSKTKKLINMKGDR